MGRDGGVRRDWKKENNGMLERDVCLIGMYLLIYDDLNLPIPKQYYHLTLPLQPKNRKKKRMLHMFTSLYPFHIPFHWVENLLEILKCVKKPVHLFHIHSFIHSFVFSQKTTCIFSLFQIIYNLKKKVIIWYMRSNVAKLRCGCNAMKRSE